MGSASIYLSSTSTSLTRRKRIKKKRKVKRRVKTTRKSQRLLMARPRQAAREEEKKKERKVAALTEVAKVVRKRNVATTRSESEVKIVIGIAREEQRRPMPSGFVYFVGEIKHLR